MNREELRHTGYRDMPEKDFRWGDQVRYTYDEHLSLVRGEIYIVIGCSFRTDHNWLIIMGKPEQFSSTSYWGGRAVTGGLMAIPDGYVHYADRDSHFELVPKCNNLCASCNGDCKRIEEMEECDFYESK